MAKSVGGTVFKIYADNNPYKKSMQDVADIRKKISDTIAIYDKKEAQSQIRIKEATEKRILKQDELNKLIADKKPAEAIFIVRNELAKLTQEEERAVEASVRLNAQRRKAYSKLTAEVEKTKIKTTETNSVIATSLKTFGAAAITAFSVDKIRTYINTLDELGKRADDFNITADGLKYLRYQASLAGISTNELDDGLKTLKKALAEGVKGVGNQADAFKALNINLKESDGSFKSFDTVLVEVADSFNKYTNTVNTAKIAEDLLGGSGQKLIRIFNVGGEAIKKNINTLGEYSLAASSAASVNDSITEAGESLDRLITKGVGGLSVIYNVLSYGLKGESYFDKISKDNHTKYLKRKSEQEATEKAIAENISKEALKEYNQQEAALNKLAALDEKLAESRLTDQDKLKKYYKEIKAYKWDLANYDELSIEYATIYENLINKQIQADSLQLKINKEKANEEARLLKLKEDAEKKKKEEADALKKKEEQQNKSFNTFLKEHFIQKKIAQALYEGKTQLAEKIKQQVSALKLSEQYNISLKEALKITSEQQKIKDIQDGKLTNTKYSEEEINKAKKVLERGEKGTVGKNTLEDAKNIVEGKETKHNLSIFEDENKRTKKNELKNNNSNANNEKETTKIFEILNEKTIESAENNKREIVDSIKELTASIQEIKNNIQAIALKKD